MAASIRRRQAGVNAAARRAPAARLYSGFAHCGNQTMNPGKVRREAVRRLTDLPNVGPATAADLRLLGITRPADLAEADPFVLYRTLCERTGTRQDPCVLDVFMSLTDFAAGGAARPWWDYTAERKRRYGSRLRDPAAG